MNSEDTIPDFLCEVFHVLRAPRRCYVLQILAKKRKNEVSTTFLARAITALEEDVPTDHATGEPYRNVYNALSQTHLSTLADAGLIIYDKDRQTIVIGPNFEFGILVLTLQKSVYQVLQKGLFPNCCLPEDSL